MKKIIAIPEIIEEYRKKAITFFKTNFQQLPPKRIICFFERHNEIQSSAVLALALSNFIHSQCGIALENPPNTPDAAFEDEDYVYFLSSVRRICKEKSISIFEADYFGDSKNIRKIVPQNIVEASKAGDAEASAIDDAIRNIGMIATIFKHAEPVILSINGHSHRMGLKTELSKMNPRSKMYNVLLNVIDDADEPDSEARAETFEVKKNEDGDIEVNIYPIPDENDPTTYDQSPDQIILANGGDIAEEIYFLLHPPKRLAEDDISDRPAKQAKPEVN